MPRTRILLLLLGLSLPLIACRCSKTGCYVQVPFGPLEYRDPCPTPKPTPPPHVPVGQEYRMVTLGSFEKPIGDFCWSADGRSIFVFVFGTKEVQQLRVPDGAILQTYSGNTDVIGALAVSPDGQWLATGASGSPILLWRVGNSKPAREIPVTLPGVQTLAFSRNSKTLGVGAGDPLNYDPKDKALELYRVADGARVWSVPYERTPRALAFGPDGTHIAVLTDLFNVRVHNAGTGELLFEKGIGGAPRTVTYSADGKWLAVATYLGVDLFSAQGEPKSKFEDSQGGDCLYAGQHAAGECGVRHQCAYRNGWKVVARDDRAGSAASARFTRWRATRDHVVVTGRAISIRLSLSCSTVAN